MPHPRARNAEHSASCCHAHIVLSQQQLREAADEIEAALLERMGRELTEVREALRESAADGRYTVAEQERDIGEVDDCREVLEALKRHDQRENVIHALMDRHLELAHQAVDGWPTYLARLCADIRNRKVPVFSLSPEVPTCQLRLIDEEGDE